MGVLVSKSTQDRQQGAPPRDPDNPNVGSAEKPEVGQDIPQIPRLPNPHVPVPLPFPDDGPSRVVPPESRSLDPSELDIALLRDPEGFGARDIDPLRSRAADPRNLRPDYQNTDDFYRKTDTWEKENAIREIAELLYLESKNLFGGSDRISGQGLEIGLLQEITKIVRDLVDQPQKRKFSYKDKESRTFIFEEGREIIKDRCFEIEITIGVTRRDTSNLIPRGDYTPGDEPPPEPPIHLVGPGVADPLELLDESSDSEVIPPHEPLNQRRLEDL